MKLLLIVICLLCAAALLWLLLIRCPRPRPLPPCRRYAHRGLHDLAAGVPENSLAAFRRAAALGYGAELDVHLTADGRLAVIHDSDLQRLCGVDGTVERSTAADLSRLRLCRTDEPIPMLEQVLPLFFGGPPLLIELKVAGGNSAALASALCAALEGRPVRCCVQSFHPLVLRRVRRLRPDLPRGQLSKNFLRDRSVPRVPAFFLTNLLFNWLSRPDFLAYRFSDRKDQSLRLCRRLFGTPEFSWTLTDAAQLRAAEADGASAIFEGFDPGPLER